ncbi:DoxX family protein [Mycobacterium crocinum]|uniref:DoxX family protein n=2 Tax=Mycolicibacterium TaxID=1866885 RepID=A0ABX8VU68_9MYCO|nr:MULTISPECIES: DoxX family protein [Mycolicibacterium]APE15071.1 DoxX subfamily protein [Mycobacterium sp. WY10]MCV7215134.1 DoxX family protein [Mycolicibacterium crocinum]QYL19550.1 DoxX family protein [Mycolicibacterium pallens]ULN39115.1 DoxX family protein [Mycolicibacterium crocinum]
MLIRRVARPMLAAVFIGQGIEALKSPKPAAEAARPTLEGLQKLPEPVSANVPNDPETLAKITAAVQIGGGVLLASGRLPRIASAALAATVIPANLGAHMFWDEPDQQLKAEKRRAFLTDLSLLGGLIIASADTAGKPSLGWRGRRAARKVSDAVSGSLPGSSHSLLDNDLLDRVGPKVGHGLQVGAERGRELALTAGERAAPLLETARKRGAELAEIARERGAELADVASERGAEFAEIARKRGADLADVASERGAELAEVARKRSADFVDVARDQGGELVDTTRARAKKANKKAKKEAKKLSQR